jgi:hypothetical protein
MHSALTANTNSHDLLFVKVSLPEFSFNLGCIYRAPRLSIPLFNDFLEHELLTDPIVISKNCILVGDFNIDVTDGLVQPTSHINFLQIMKENNFNQYVHEKTHCCLRLGLPVSTLDHVWANFFRNSRATLYCL